MRNKELERLVDVGALLGTDGQDQPGVVHDVVQIQACNTMVPICVLEGSLAPVCTFYDFLFGYFGSQVYLIGLLATNTNQTKYSLRAKRGLQWSQEHMFLQQGRDGRTKISSGSLLSSLSSNNWCSSWSRQARKPRWPRVCVLGCLFDSSVHRS